MEKKGGNKKKNGETITKEKTEDKTKEGSTEEWIREGSEEERREGMFTEP